MQRKTIQTKMLNKAKTALGKRCLTARSSRRTSEPLSPKLESDPYPVDYEEPVKAALANSQSQPALRVSTVQTKSRRNLLTAQNTEEKIQHQLSMEDNTEVN